MYDPDLETIQQIQGQLPGARTWIETLLSEALKSQRDSTFGSSLLGANNDFLVAHPSGFTLAELLQEIPGRLIIWPVSDEVQIVVTQGAQDRTTTVVRRTFEDVEIVIEKFPDWGDEQAARFVSGVNLFQTFLSQFDGVVYFAFTAHSGDK